MESPPSTERTGAAAGDVIGHEFVVEHVIGEGTTTIVVAARHKELGTRVAVRIARAADHESAARFKRAARAMAALESPYTVRVHEIGETREGLPCAIMELLDGKTLEKILDERGRIGIDDAIHWMLQTCEAIAEAHDAGLLHRNLEPRSLFLVDAGDAPGVRVLDFGLGWTERAVDPGEMTLKPGEAPGTSRLMAPEQLRGDPLDVRVDVWGAGACLFRMLTKRDPFGGETLAELRAAIVDGPPPKLGRHRPEVGSGLEALVLRCLQRDPRDRFRDVRELAQALREARDEARNTPLVPVGEAMLQELRATPIVLRAAEAHAETAAGAPGPQTLRIVPPPGPPTPEDGPETIPLGRRAPAPSGEDRRAPAPSSEDEPATMVRPQTSDPKASGARAPTSAEQRETAIRAALGEALAPLLASTETASTDASTVRTSTEASTETASTERTSTETASTEIPIVESAPVPPTPAEPPPAGPSAEAPPALAPSSPLLQEPPARGDARGGDRRMRRVPRRSRLGPVLFGLGFVGTITVAFLHARHRAPEPEPVATSSPIAPASPSASAEPTLVAASAEPPPSSNATSAQVAVSAPSASEPSADPAPRASTRRRQRPQPPPAPTNAEPGAEEDDPILKKRK